MPPGFPAQAGDSLHFANQTTLHPIGVAALAIALIAAFLLPRPRALLPMVALIAMIPSAQRVVIVTLDFNLVRLMVLGMLLRITLRGEWRGFRLRVADMLLLAWAGWAIVAYGLLLGEAGAVITRTGYMMEAVGAYFVGRVLLQNTAALRQLVRFCAALAVISVLFFLIERLTARNMFSVFGGVPEFTMAREGKLRCQGPFSHPIMAGIFWASLLPLFAAAWFAYPRSRLWLGAAGTAALIIIVNTASSTPVMAVFIGCAAFAMYPIRSITPIVRWMVLAAVVFLHIVMENGVHHLLARINVIGGSTGWHRYHLMDAAMRHFEEWAAFGTASTAHWGWGLQDVTNQYVLEGVRGGALTLALFAAWIIAVFVVLSRAIRRERDDARRLLLWACGAMLFTHCLNFIAVSYFGQLVSSFYMLTGMTVSLAVQVRSGVRSPLSRNAAAGCTMNTNRATARENGA